MPPPRFLENIVILCFKRRFSKQNSVIRLKSNILALPNFCPPQIFGLATPLAASERVFCKRVTAGHVVNSRRANLKSSSVNDILFFNGALKLKTKRSRLTKRFHIFTSPCFLWASVGFEMNHWINFQKRWKTLHEILVVFRRWQVQGGNSASGACEVW